MQNQKHNSPLSVIFRIARGDDIENKRFYIFCIFVIFSFLSKGGVFFGGMGVDDYAMATANDPARTHLMFEQGRWLQALLTQTLTYCNVGSASQTISFGFLSIFLLATLVFSILRFLDLLDRPYAAIVGAFIIAQPYGVEIYTYKVTLPTVSLALLLTAGALEFLSSNMKRIHKILLSSACILGMLLLYQVYFNYLAVTFIYAVFLAAIVPEENSKPNTLYSRYKQPADLLAAMLLALFLFGVAMKTAVMTKLVSGMVDRAQFINFGMLPKRAHEAALEIGKIYLDSEPIMPVWLKVIALAIGAFSATVFLFRKSKQRFGFKGRAIILAALLAALLVLSIGLILPFKSWWPVPRVLSQVGLIVGLFFLTVTAEVWGSTWKIVRLLFVLSIIASTLAFLAIDNQIFSDQITLNKWDQSAVTAMYWDMLRQPGSDNIERVYINTGSWRRALMLPTTDGDMNISAFGVQWAHTALLNYSVGSNYSPPDISDSLRGSTYCKSAPHWPQLGSIKVIGRLGIICILK